MACLGVKPGAAGWKAQTNALNYGGPPNLLCLCIKLKIKRGIENVGSTV